MEIAIKGEVKEIAALVLEVQERQKEMMPKELTPGTSVVLNGRQQSSNVSDSFHH